MPSALVKQRSLKALTPEQTKNLRNVFDGMDTDGSDDLDYTELKDALASSGVEISLKELKALWVAADKDGSSGLSFNEFAAAIEKMDDPALRDKITSAGADEGGGCVIA